MGFTKVNAADTTHTVPHAMRCLSLAVLASVAVSACEEPVTVPVRIVPPPMDTVRVHEIVPGVRHIYRWEASGPWAIHVLEVNLEQCGMGIRSIKAGDRLIGRETTSSMVARLMSQQPRPVYGAVNADFFSSTPPGVPVGAQVTDGEIVRGATNRPVFGVSRQGALFFGADLLTGTLRTRRGSTAELRRINERPDTLRLALYNRFMGGSTPADTGTVEVVAHPVAKVAAVGDTVRAVVLQVDTASAGVTIPADGVVIAGRGRGGNLLRTDVAVGDTIRWVLRFPGAPGPIVELVAGDPQLLRAGNSLEPFAWAVERHPRTGIGVTRDRKLLLVTVDGRQPGYSLGMTLPELTALFQRLGATDALNLDGGGSTTAVVTGRVVNRPSDSSGERAVANAVAVLGPASACGK